MTTPSGQMRRVRPPRAYSHACARTAETAYGQAIERITQPAAPGSCEARPPSAKAATHTRSASSGGSRRRAAYDERPLMVLARQHRDDRTAVTPVGGQPRAGAGRVAEDADDLHLGRVRDLRPGGWGGL